MSAHHLASLVAHLALDCDDLYTYLDHEKSYDRESLIKTSELERRFGSLSKEEEELIREGDFNRIFKHLATRGPNRDRQPG